MEANAAVDDDEFAFCGEDTALAVSPDSWLADSACTSHIAQDRNIVLITLQHQDIKFPVLENPLD